MVPCNHTTEKRNGIVFKHLTKNVMQMIVGTHIKTLLTDGKRCEKTRITVAIHILHVFAD